MASHVECCELCHGDVSRANEKAKRVKLFGPSAKELKEKIDDFLIKELGLKLSDTKARKDGYVCHKCRNELERYYRQMKDLHESRIKLMEKYRTGLLPIGYNLRSGMGTYSPTAGTMMNSISVASESRKTTSTTPKRSRARQESRSRVKVSLDYPSGTKHFTSSSPWTTHNIRRICRGNYPTLASAIATSDRTTNATLVAVVRTIRKEIKHICSLRHDSILRNNNEGIKHFSWNTIWAELMTSTPLFMQFLCLLIHNPLQHKPLICLVASMVLKQSNSQVSLCQRVMSMILYSSGSPKKVYWYFQKLMLSHSHKQTIRLVNGVMEDYDVCVHEWSNTFINDLKARKSMTTNNRCDVFDIVEEENIETACSNEEDHDAEDDDAVTVMIGDHVAEMDSDCEGEDEDDDNNVDQEERSDHGDENDSMDEDEEDVLRTVHEEPLLDVESDTSAWRGYKIVGDNVDKNVRRSFQRSDRTTQSLHYFHTYALLDRVDLTGVSDEASQKQITFESLLPSAIDIVHMKEIFSILVSRILVSVLPDFKRKTDDVTWHIPHAHQQEMSQKSTVVPLGIIMRNENKLDEMCLILDDLSKYCPIHAEDAKIQLKDGRQVNCRIAKSYETLLGGDQLTCARVRGAQSLRKTHDGGTDHQLKCFVPCVEDWHSRLTLVTVIWDRMFTKNSQTERGTLYQLRNLLNFTSLPKEPKANMKSCEDFLTIVLYALLKAGAKTVMEESAPRPIEDINALSEAIVSKFVNIDKISITTDDDDVHLYTTELLTLLLLWYNYRDSVREGDGDRVMAIWKFLLVIFKKSRRTNYSIEALNMLVHYHFLLSDRMAQQLKWSRFVNIHGRQGCNVSCDLHLEHLNRRFKGSLQRLGSANLQASTIIRLGRSIGAVHSIEAEFSRLLNCSSASNVHHRPSHAKDVEKVSSVLEEIKAFKYIQNRKFSVSGFTNRKPMLDVIDKDNKIVDWMVERIAPLIF